jgi:DNA ligase-1
MSVNGTPKVTFYVFDRFSPVSPYAVREANLEKTIKNHSQYPIRLVRSSIIRNEVDLYWYEQWCLDSHFEGAMIRQPLSTYKQGRSTLDEGHLLKLKRYLDSEATIIGYEEGMQNGNEAKKNELGYQKRSSHKENMIPKDTLGAIIVRDCKTGVEFNIGTGFDAIDCTTIWKNREKYLGKTVSYRYFPTGSKDKPRHPSFKGFRDPIDLVKG